MTDRNRNRGFLYTLVRKAIEHIVEGGSNLSSRHLEQFRLTQEPIKTRHYEASTGLAVNLTI